MILISSGIALFLFKGDVPTHRRKEVPREESLTAVALKKGTGSEETSFWSGIWGYALLLASLAFDGLTGPAQERLYEVKTSASTSFHCETADAFGLQKYNPKPTFVHVMFYSNLWAVLYMGIGLVLTGETVPAIYFTIQYHHP